PVAPTTAEQRLAKKNELKARGTLMMALPDKHQLKFNTHKDAKSLMEAIEKRFGGNKETKKVQKTLLKQQYKNFNGSSSKSLDQIHDRLQKLISQLKILGESLSQEDINLKFLRSLPCTRLKIHLLGGLVSAVTSVSTASTKVPVSAPPNVDNLSDAVVYSFFANQSNSLQLDNDDLKQIDANDLEEIDLKWQMAMLTMRARRFLQRTGRNLGANRTTSIGFDMSKHDWRFQTDEEPTNYALMAFTYSSSLSSDNENENVFEEDIKLLKLDVTLKDNALVELRKKFEKAEQDRDEYKLGEGYHVVPPPYTGTFMPPKPDLIFYDVPTAHETVPTVLNVKPSTTKPNKYLSHSNRPSAPIIEDWFSDSEDESESEPMPTQKAPSFVQTYEHVKTPRPSVKPVEHPILAGKLRKYIPKSRGHRYSWNRKACFICKSLTYLIKDCDYYEKKMVQKPVRNHAMKGNHQYYARMTHPHPHRHVVPTSVLTRSRLVPLTAARPVSTDVPQTNVQHQRPTKHGVNKAHSPIRRLINLRSSPKNSNFHQKVTTIKANQVNAVKGAKGN
nr:hypothetical protein [Tanacetum cinerariifolium]